MIEFLKKIIRKINGKYYLTFIDDDHFVDHSIRKKEVLVVGDNKSHWVLILYCPCGCGEKIHLNTLPSENPYWKLRSNMLSRISIYPSIWRTKGCNSHFFIRSGKVVWA